MVRYTRLTSSRRWRNLVAHRVSGERGCPMHIINQSEHVTVNGSRAVHVLGYKLTRACSMLIQEQVASLQVSCAIHRLSRPKGAALLWANVYLLATKRMRRKYTILMRVMRKVSLRSILQCTVFEENSRRGGSKASCIRYSQALAGDSTTSRKCRSCW